MSLFAKSLLARGTMSVAIACSWLAAHVGGAAAVSVNAKAGFSSQPLYFEAHEGQWNESDSTFYLARTREALFTLSATEASITLSKAGRPEASGGSLEERLRLRTFETKTIHMRLLGANTGARVSGLDYLEGKVNYFIGNDPTAWQTAVPLFSKVRIQDVYPGVELIYYGNQQELEYDFVIGPAADPNTVSFQVSGADRLQVDSEGGLVITLGRDAIRQHKLVAYQDIGGVRKIVEARYKLKSHDTVTFELGAYDHSQPLVIDPVLSYSLLLGGSGTDIGFDIALDGSGNIYVAGETISPNLPVTTNAFQKNYRGGLPGLQGDAFIAKFDNSGSNLVYLTYLGGTGDDVALRLTVDSEGAAYITGVTDSTNFPTQSAIYNQISGIATNFHGQVTNATLFPWDAFVTKLDPTGSSLTFSTYLGGDNQDEGLGIALDSSRNVYVAGFTTSTNFPIVNAAPGFDKTNGLSDVFVTRINSAGTAIDYSIRFGGTNDDQAGGIAVTADGTAYVTGWTASTNFPVTSDAFQPFLAAFRDAFVAVVSPSGALLSSTFIGGVDDDFGFKITLDSAGTPYIAGSDQGAGFPITPGNLNPGGVFFSDNGAGDWSQRNSGLSYNVINSLALAPNDPATLYVGNWRGISVSTNAGFSWQPVPIFKQLLQIPAIVVDPANAFKIYAGVSSNVWTVAFTTNWTVTSTGIVNQLVNKLTLDPNSPSTLYASTEGGVFKSTNSALTWFGVNTDLTEKSVRDVALDPVDHNRIYAATGDGIFFSTNAGGRWFKFKSGLSGRALFTHSLSIDPVQPSTVYVATEGGIRKSFDSGTNWVTLNGGLTTTNLLAVIMQPGLSSVLYAGSTNGLFKSVNGGTNWNAFNNGLTVSNITALAIRPDAPTSVYAATHGQDNFGATDAFVARLGANPFFCVLGGNNLDEAWDVSVDPAGNMYVVGNTFSTNLFTTTNNLAWPLSTTNGGKRDIFVAAISADASQFLYSAYLGGTNEDFGYAIQSDAAGNAYIVGETASKNFPTRNTARTSFGGTNDVVLAKIGMNVTPTLLSSLVGNQIILRWPAFAPEYVLQSTANLGPSAVWAPVSGVPVVINGFHTVTVDPTNGAAFFRLKK